MMGLGDMWWWCDGDGGGVVGLREVWWWNGDGAKGVGGYFKYWWCWRRWWCNEWCGGLAVMVLVRWLMVVEQWVVRWWERQELW